MALYVASVNQVDEETMFSDLRFALTGIAEEVRRTLKVAAVAALIDKFGTIDVVVREKEQAGA